MAPKRKSDTISDLVPPVAVLSDNNLAKENKAVEPAPILKKLRVADDGPDASSSKSKSRAKKAIEDAPKHWKNVTLEGQEAGEVPIYDNCNEIRRKIRVLQKNPGWKVTQWLKEIGDINNNSYGRFMKATGPTGGASNGTYYAAYVYFEKVRIMEGKKKTATRQRNEDQYPDGLTREDRRTVWVFGRA